MSITRTIWILKCRRAGDLAQLRTLAELLRAKGAWQVEEKQLAFRAPGLVRFPAAARFLLDSKLEPPWPNLVLVAEAVASHVARLVKAKSGGKTKIVALGRPAGETNGFDLVLATAQYDLRPAANVVMLPLPLAKHPMVTQAERQAFTEKMARRPRPWTALLVGGAVPPDVLDGTVLAELAYAARNEASQTGGSVIVFTSPRTGEENEKELLPLLPAEAFVQCWPGGRTTNFYAAALAEADRFLVTSDSISMAAEAIDTGKPVSVFMLPQRATSGLKLLSALNARAGLSAERGPLSFVFTKGILEAPPDRQKFFRELIKRGAIAAYPEFSAGGADAVTRSVEIAAQSIARLFV